MARFLEMEYQFLTEAKNFRLIFKYANLPSDYKMTLNQHKYTEGQE